MVGCVIWLMAGSIERREKSRFDEEAEEGEESEAVGGAVTEPKGDGRPEKKIFQASKGVKFVEILPCGA